jgi:hypothetical protein
MRKSPAHLSNILPALLVTFFWSKLFGIEKMGLVEIPLYLDRNSHKIVFN